MDRTCPTVVQDMPEGGEVLPGINSGRILSIPQLKETYFSARTKNGILFIASGHYAGTELPRIWRVWSSPEP